MSDPTPIDLSPEALERACMELGSPFDPDDMKITRDVVAGYFEGLGTLDEMVERGARAFAPEVPPTNPCHYETEWTRLCRKMRAALQAALTQAAAEK